MIYELSWSKNQFFYGFYIAKYVLIWVVGLSAIVQCVNTLDPEQLAKDGVFVNLWAYYWLDHLLRQFSAYLMLFYPFSVLRALAGVKYFSGIKVYMQILFRTFHTLALYMVICLIAMLMWT